MSSKEQFRDALKNEKRLITNMRKEIEVRDRHIESLKQQIQNLERDIQVLNALNYGLSKTLESTKRWYQIFIKYPVR